MQLFLIRHAESMNNAKPPEQRIEDPPITPLGEMQAEHLAGWTKSMQIDTLITSPVLRALQTTRRIHEATGQHVHVWANVFEEGGIYRGHGPQATQGGPGLSRSDVLRHAAADSSRCTLDPSIVPSGWWGGRDRETGQQASHRGVEVTRRLIQAFGSSGRIIFAVIHADFKRKLLVEMIGDHVDPRAFGKLRNTGITKLDFDGERWQLDWFNSVSHLPAELITGNES